MNGSEYSSFPARLAVAACALALASPTGVAWAQRPRRAPTPPTVQPSPPPQPVASPAPTAATADITQQPTDPASAGARDVLEGGQVITLAEALDTARRNVPSVLAAIAQTRVAEGQLALARTPLMPSVTGTITAAANGSNSNCFSFSATPCPMLSGGTTSNGTNGTLYADSTISARWMLWDFGRTSLNVDAARLSLQGAQAQVRAAERLAVTAAATGYFVLLADEEAVASAVEILRQRERQLDIARRRVAAGVNPPIDQTRAEIAAQSSRLDLSSAEAAVLNDAAALSIALALDPARPIRAVRPTEVTVDEDPVRAAEAAVASRPEIVAAHLRVQTAMAQVAVARAGWRPSLTANAAVGARFSAYSQGTGTASEAANANVVFSVPIYDPTIPANVRIAEGNALAARVASDQAELQVRGDAVQAAIAVRAARQQLAQAERSAELAAANLAQAEGRYAAGAAQLVELVDAQAQDATARLAVIQRRFQVGRARVALLASMGRLGELGR